MTKADIMKEYDFVILMPPEELYRELTEEEARDFIDCAAKMVSTVAGAWVAGSRSPLAPWYST